jgi:hypothetical protein
MLIDVPRIVQTTTAQLIALIRLTIPGEEIRHVIGSTLCRKRITIQPFRTVVHSPPPD